MQIFDENWTIDASKCTNKFQIKIAQLSNFDFVS